MPQERSRLECWRHLMQDGISGARATEEVWTVGPASSLSPVQQD